MVALCDRVSAAIGTQKQLPREFLAELVGTFLLVFIGVSCNIQQVASPTGNVTSAQIGWALGFAFACYLTSGVSAGHVNPAFSIAALVNGQMTPLKCAVYIAAQMIGAFAGAAVAYGGHIDDIALLESRPGWAANASSGGLSMTAGLFATYPAGHMSLVGALFDQMIGTALLAGCISSICDKRLRISSALVPVLCGLVILMISMSYGSNTGYAINPARDLGPRLLLLASGYGWVVFSARNYYFWVPIVGPIAGALLGGWLYNLLVGIHGLNAQVEITGGKPYPREDRNYKVITVNDHNNNGATQ